MSAVRRARPEDVPVVVQLIKELAVYEREPQAVVATEQHLRDALFSDDAKAFCLVAADGDEVVGFAVYFLNFSTWLGTHGIYLEDLFVRPEARGGGHGRALLQELARIAVERGYGRVEWAVLDWNEPAQGFYDSLGARPQDDWTVWRLTGAALQALGHQ
ncbi:MAG TPA: GNAT family N-acetyltransferase [Mycobacteriales bacterium]|jgi:GNAT superfamily N-acetyltransferase|nr:GNAT family N-acetyltransferase [Mycobacteriales bacterium]